MIGLIAIVVMLGVAPALSAMAVHRQVRTRTHAVRIAAAGVVVTATLLILRRVLFWDADMGFRGNSPVGVFAISLLAAFATGMAVSGLLIAMFGPESHLEERPLYPVVIVAASVVVSMLILMGLLRG
ncbi:hypothetical protein HKCCE3408_00630 [Rhodobacterales bacterium HKCCE3408]|nr:hypothetical protein [Rhodobacterales bacterium HKCCE3408]